MPTQPSAPGEYPLRIAITFPAHLARRPQAFTIWERWLVATPESACACE